MAHDPVLSAVSLWGSREACGEKEKEEWLLLARGEYSVALGQGLGVLLLEKGMEPKDLWSGEIADHLKKDKEVEEALDAVGVSALLMFCEANMIGSYVECDAEYPCCPMELGGISGSTAKQLGVTDLPLALGEKQHGDSEGTMDDFRALNMLGGNGEDFVGKLYIPQYLLLAKSCFDALVGLAGDARLEYVWWRLRVSVLRQRLLAGLSKSIYDQIVADMGTLERCVPVDYTQGDLNAEEILIIGALHLELGHAERIYGHVEEAKRHVEMASHFANVQTTLTGALGVRTVHQQDPHAQLVVEITDVKENGEHGSSTSCATGSHASDYLDKNVLHLTGTLDEKHSLAGLDTDSDVLKGPKLLGGCSSSLQRNDLNALQQLVLLSKCYQVKKGSSADGTQQWEMAAYIETVLSQHHSDLEIRIAAHMEMARLEMPRSRTRERALVTLEAIKEARMNPNKSIYPCDRSRYAFSTANPCRSLLLKELGEAYVSCGLVGAALPLFEAAEVWDSLIVCYRLLEKTEVAEQLVRQRLEITPNDPKLWCTLGDLLNSKECYEEAWQRSGNRSARAQRSLARAEMRCEHYEKAASHWRLALNLSPLHSEAWFSLGWSLIKLEDLSGAAEALTRLVQMEPDDGRAWNNLAMVHMKLEHWDEAFIALGEATKHARETWQMWENYAAVAVKVEEYPTAARALDHMVSLTRGDNFDLDVIGSLTNRVHEHPEDKTLAEGLGKIFKKIAASSKGSGVAAFWAFYAQYHETLGSKEASVDCLSRQLRCLQSSRWHEEEEAFIEYSKACLVLVQAYMANGNARELNQARMLLRNTVQRAKEYFDDHQCYMELCDKLEDLKSTQ